MFVFSFLAYSKGISFISISSLLLYDDFVISNLVPCNDSTLPPHRIGESGKLIMLRRFQITPQIF